MSSKRNQDKPNETHANSAVIATNDDAFRCKLSAIRCGYYTDEFLEAIVDELPTCIGTTATPRRPPIINRGTFARVQVVQQIVETFIADCVKLDTRAQILSFGAGYDTLPFRIFDKKHTNRRGISYIELDFETVTSTKAQLVTRVSRISALFDEIKVDENCALFANCASSKITYALGVCDLRDIETLKVALSNCRVDTSIPTLFLTECVLIYLKPNESDSLLEFASSSFKSSSMFVNYEPMRPTDAFGARMVENIAKRGSPLLGISAFPDENSQKTRFNSRGWRFVDAINMRSAFDNMFSFDEKIKLNFHEVLDEIEEWNLIMEHYVIVCARSSRSLSLHKLFSSN